MSVTWRASAATTIRQALDATRGRPEKEIRAALRKAYPWGERKYWPYKVWCSEIRRQRGLETSPARRAAIKAGQVDLPLVACGSGVELSLDHVKHYSAGGQDTVENLRVACMPCNRRRGNRW